MPEHDQPTGAAPVLNSKILTFEVLAEDYGIDINRVREIRGWSQVRSVPGAADFVLGILRLRGAVIPIVDLRRRLGLGESVCDHRTVIIIVALGEAQGVSNVGLVVDAVSDVVDLSRGRLLASPELGTPAQKALVREVALLDERMYLLIDLDRIFDQKQLAALETVVAPG
ncbi:MAG: chemotaxis protein CheW [Wenzhouxiangella sp.]